MFNRRSLLGFSTNPKTVKGEKIGYYTGILYLAPSDLSGYQVCPMAKLAKCDVACLNTSGRGAFNSIQLARINKTKYFFNNRNEFMINIYKDIEKGIRKALSLNQELLIRLNGTSDIKFEYVDFTYNGIHYNNIMEAFPHVQFYDYTKIPNRNNLPSNYDLTFSFSNAITFHKYNDIAINNKERIAVVFRYQKDIPITFKGLNVIGGDNSDVRHIEDKNTVVALYAKGKGKKDNTGFIVG
jgi:hypothetical protein